MLTLATRSESIKGILPLWPVASHTGCMYGSMLMRISVDVSFIVISLCTVQLFLPLNYVQEREMPLFPMSTRPSQRHRHAFFSPLFSVGFSRAEPHLVYEYDEESHVKLPLTLPELYWLIMSCTLAYVPATSTMPPMTRTSALMMLRVMFFQPRCHLPSLMSWNQNRAGK